MVKQVRKTAEMRNRIHTIRELQKLLTDRMSVSPSHFGTEAMLIRSAAFRQSTIQSASGLNNEKMIERYDDEFLKEGDTLEKS
jgi:hypothetical protein